MFAMFSPGAVDVADVKTHGGDIGSGYYHRAMKFAIRIEWHSSWRGREALRGVRLSICSP